jgi:hypothetical protein
MVQDTFLLRFQNKGLYGNKSMVAHENRIRVQLTISPNGRETAGNPLHWNQDPGQPESLLKMLNQRSHTYAFE